MKKLIALLVLLSSLHCFAIGNKIIVGTTAGGSTDDLARHFGQYITEQTQQQYAIENIAGAGGIIAMTQIKQSPPNTLMIISSSWYLQITEGKFVLADFKPVAVLAEAPFFLIVNRSQGLTCERIRNSTVNMFLGTGALGQTSVLARRVNKKYPNISEVPYKGNRQAVMDLLGNHIQSVLVGSMAEMQPALDILANSSARRINGIPTFKECLGIDTPLTGQFLLIASPNSDEQFVSDTNALAVRYINDTATKNYLKLNLITGMALDRTQTDLQIRKELQVWQSLQK